MKVAIVTDDGQSVSRHFGRAAAYLVITVENGAVTGREVRPKPSPHAAGEQHSDASHTSPEAHARHDAMLAPVADCTFVVAGGMGQGAFDRIAAVGMTPVVSRAVDPDAIALACADGTIENLVNLLH